LFRKLLVLLVGLSLAAALVVALQNDRFARENRQVEIAVDHHEILEILRRSGVEEEAFLRGLQAWGVTSIAVREDSLEQLEDYHGALLYRTGAELLWEGRPGATDPALFRHIQEHHLDPHSAYLLVEDAALAETLQQKIALLLQRQVEITPLETAYLLEMGYLVERDFRVELDQEAIRRYRELGFYLVPRPDNANINSPEAARALLESFFSLEGISTVVFDGPQVTGHPAFLDQTAHYLEASGRPAGVIKYIVPQHGMAALLEKSGYPSVLVHSNYPKVPPVLIASSVLEDNIRLLYVRFDLDRPGNLALQAEDTLSTVSGTLQQWGYSLGPAQPLEMTRLSPGLLFLLALGGVLASGLLLLERCLGRLRDGLLLLLFAAGLLALAGLLLLLPLHTAARLLALAAAVIFPALAVISRQLDLEASLYRLGAENRPAGSPAAWKRLRGVLVALLTTLAIAAAGGIIASALTAGPYFLSGTAQYRGIKIAYLAPLALVFLQALSVVGRGENRWRLRSLLTLAENTWKTPLQLRHLLFLVAAGLLLYFYVLRSGHTDEMTLSVREIQLRYFFLEQLLVRPRFKELLIGHPLALLALALVAWRGLRYPLLTGFAFCAGSIGAVSIVNSFSHWTTPASVSLLRTFHGLWLGLLVGGAVTALVMGLIFLMEKRGEMR